MRNDFETVKQAVSIRDYCERHLEPKGKTWVCPKCNSGNGPNGTPALKLYEGEGHVYCHACGNNFDVFDLAGIVNGTDDKLEQLRIVADEYGIELEDGNEPLNLGDIISDDGIDHTNETRDKWDLDEYARRKGLNPDYLRQSFNMGNFTMRDGSDVVTFPYPAYRHEGLFRIRWRFGGGEKVWSPKVGVGYRDPEGRGADFWNKRPKGETRPNTLLPPYGHWMFEGEAQQIVLVEGESDTQAMWYAGNGNYPTLGIPGAGNYTREMDGIVDELLEAGGTVYVHDERDKGDLTGSVYKFRPRFKVFSCKDADPECKDPSDLLLKYGKDRFVELMDGLIEGAIDYKPQEEIKLDMRLPGYLVSVEDIVDTINMTEGRVDELLALDGFKFWLRLCFWCDRFPKLMLDVAKELNREDDDPEHRDLAKAVAWHSAHQGDIYGWGRLRYRKLSKEGQPTQTILHDRLARDIIDEEHACLIYGAPAVWLGDHWGVGNSHVSRLCRQRLGDVNNKGIIEVEKYILDMGQHKEETDFDGEPYVAFSDGTVLNLRTFKTVKPNPSMFITNVISAPWVPKDDPNGEARRFISELADYDNDVFTALLEIVGVSMTSSQIATQMAWLIGRARNPGNTDGTANTGKSTFEDVLIGLLGRENCASLSLNDFGKRFHTSGLVGKLANIGDDVSSVTINRDSSSTLKTVITSNSLHAEAKYEAPFDYSPTCNLVFSMNEMPCVEGVDSGFARRFALVPFRHRFEQGKDERHDIRRVMAQPENRAELAYMACCAVNVMIAEGRTTFTPIEGMQQEVYSLFRDSDSVRAWVYDADVTLEYIYRRLTADIYQEYRSWAEQNGLDQSDIANNIAFGRRMCKLFQVTTTSSNDCETGKRGKVFVPRT